jgi:hypothetical protein
MSKIIFEHSCVTVASYCGPANTIERTRMRVQIFANPTVTVSLGFNDVVALYNALDRWIAEHRGKSGS